MKDAINYFIPILKDPMNDITGRCMMNNSLDSTYCGSYHQSSPPTTTVKVINVINPQPQPVNAHYPDVQMETNSMDIQYNNLIEMDDYADTQEQNQALHLQQQRLQQNRKRNNFDCDIDGFGNVKRSRREEPDPSFFVPSMQLQSEAVQPPPNILPTTQQTHQRRPTHNMPDYTRCMMGHYV